MGRKPRQLPAPNEDDVTAAVVEHWRKLGVPGSLVASIPNKRAFGQTALTPGLPDLLVMSPALGMVTGFIELKRKGGVLSDDQIEIGRLIVERGAPYKVTFGRDEPIGVLEAWGAVRPT